MKNLLPASTNRARVISAALAIVVFPASLPALAEDGLCDPLLEFVKSVKPGETRALKFNTIMGSNFKDREGAAKGAKRCEFNSYEPAKTVCKYLMSFSASDSSGYNARSAITCLSPKTRFATGTRLHAISFSTPVGLSAHPNHVDVVYDDDQELGGMALTITVNGSQDAG